MATTYTRNNAWNHGGDFTNPDLFWYEKGVSKMMSRSLDDQASWWFFAAIHGEYVNPKNAWYVTPPAFPDWGYITSPPKVPTSPLPSQANQDLFWNQCQHQSWYFPPWHRGYLLALEAQLRVDIVSLGGPASWALPFWNYFGGVKGSQYQMPPAFAAKTLPDGSPNALYVAMRYGPDQDANIYLPTPAGEAAHPGDPNYSRGPVLETCLTNDIYTGSDRVTKPPGFGGPETGFNHDGGTSGNLEGNPHNLVHVYVGGIINDTDYGLMADPGTAALDPIFYIHHANIDRMWAEWNANGHANPPNQNWLNGPTQQFIMPWPGGKSWSYTPMQVDSLSKLDYVYQAQAAPLKAATAVLAERLTRLGAPAPADQVRSALAISTEPKPAELLGANAGSLRIQGLISRAAVKLDRGVRGKVMSSLAAASVAALPDRIYLKLENIQGTTDTAVLGAYINLPDNAQPGASDALFAGSVGLFGLRRASVKDGHHAAAGLTFVLDITDIVDQLYLTKGFEVDSLSVSVAPSRPLPAKTNITIGRISIFRQSS